MFFEKMRKKGGLYVDIHNGKTHEKCRFCSHYKASQNVLSTFMIINSLETLVNLIVYPGAYLSLIFGVGAIFVYSYSQIIKTIDNSKEIDTCKTQICAYCPPPIIELALCSSAFRLFVNQINL